MNIFQWVVNNLRSWFSKPMDDDVSTLRMLVRDWEMSEMLSLQKTGMEYYLGIQDILNPKYSLVLEDTNRLNRDLKKRIVDNQYKRVVDQKNNYSFGKPFTIQHSDQAYNEQLNAILSNVFLLTFRRITLDMFNCGVGYLYLFYDENGDLQCERFKPWECIPVWADDEHDVLESLIHVIDTSSIQNGLKVTEYAYEFYEKDGVTVYNKNFEPMYDKQAFMEVDGYPYNWERLPIVQFKLNDTMTPLIHNVKTAQDALNHYESMYYNNITKDARDTLFVLKGYPDESMPTFYDNIMRYGAIAVDGDGAVETLDVASDPNAYNIMVKELKKTIVENAMSYWRDLDRLGTNVNQMNILSMYSDIDLDADSIEAEVLRAFDEILWFINTHLDVDYDKIKDVTVTFNRNMIMNETDTIDNIAKSRGIISESTLLQHHPWVNNLETEMENLDSDREAMEKQLQQEQATSNGQQDNTVYHSENTLNKRSLNNATE